MNQMSMLKAVSQLCSCAGSLYLGSGFKVLGLNEVLDKATLRLSFWDVYYQWPMLQSL